MARGTHGARPERLFYAHTLPGRPAAEWQPLVEHHSGVAEMARGFAEAFGAGDWGYLAGHWHDIGKFSDAFQSYLSTASSPDPHVADSATRTDHSTAGAQHAVETLGILGHLLGYVLAGHHSGLLDGRAESACQESRLGKIVPTWQRGSEILPVEAAPALPGFLKDAFRDPFCLSFFTRFVFSCLVDADFLDTERFMDPERAAARPVWPEDILARMAEALDSYVEVLLPDGEDPGPVDLQRAHVREACLAAAQQPSGLFSLTVPTGGGKTLSSLAFALRHAEKCGLRRVVYVIPFTSIVEQNAGVFREAMAPLREAVGADPVLEHHCNVDVGGHTLTSRLATENWDAPLVVTTSVQFYESLFANRSSRCRKLHNLANAVIILDEVQTLPVDFLEPCLKALRELAGSYGSTVVLCTATQPAIHRREGFDIGLEGVREIVPDPGGLYQSLERVRVEDIGRQEDTEVVRRLREERQVLCIVNTRGHARGLFDALEDAESHFHLSALMCPVHRSEVLSTIRQRLEGDLDCRVVSTQLIEAGVDIDFPVVYRSLAGLDSVAQAAGRCNRSGRLTGMGRTFVFRSEHTKAERYFAETANCGAQVLDLHENPLSLEAVEHYFRLYYWDQSSRWDAKGILDEFKMHAAEPGFPFSFGFAKVADAFRLIEDSGRPVIVPWREEGRRLCEELRSPWRLPDRMLLRRLQRYTVQVPRRHWEEHRYRTIELVRDRYPVLISADTHYSDVTGLTLEGLDTHCIV